MAEERELVATKWNERCVNVQSGLSYMFLTNYMCQFGGHMDVWRYGDIENWIEKDMNRLKGNRDGHDNRYQTKHDSSVNQWKPVSCLLKSVVVPSGMSSVPL